MLKNGRTYPGNPMQLTVTLVDENGTAVDPDTVTFKTYDPWDRKVTYTYGTDSEVTRSSAGVYVAEITPDKAGRWKFRWQTTGPVFATEDSFIVLTSPFYEDCYEDYV
ncbi:conserved protein of unknown function [Hyphomicrobium sp. 1Nfss2.1]|uniref:hypothetical protein n=1 Tax=Hyphomicrobium sp. 1Nfss2.1 TaxID=3413936 RepID=UPI003C7A08BB